MLTTYVRTLLGSDPGLVAETVDINKIFLTHALDTPQVRPFLVLNWGVTSPGLETVRRRVLQVWIHDDPGDYARIDRCLDSVYKALFDIAGINTGTVDKWISQVIWDAFSENMSDDAGGTIMRHADFTIVGSAA
jgi:hypothetical protein